MGFSRQDYWGGLSFPSPVRGVAESDVTEDTYQRWEGDGGRQDNEDHTFLVKHFQWPRWGRGFRKHLHFLPFGEFLLYFGVKASVHKTGEMEDTWCCVRSVPLIFPVYR